MRKHYRSVILLIWLVCSFLCFVGCRNMSSEIQQKISGSSEVEASMTISSELLNPRSTITMDSILDVVEYIPLETNDSAIIGRIDEIVLTNDLIIILDKTQTESIFLFNRTGEFIAKVNRKGKGPGEYMQPSDITVDEQLQELYLLNEFPSKVIVYDFEGNFIKEFSLPFRFLAFESIGDNEFVFTNEPNNRKYGNPVGKVNNIFSKLFFI